MRPERIHYVSPGALTAVLALSGTVVALMQTLLVPLLPDFPAILGVTAEEASWLVTATLLSSAVATPIVSRCADMYGKRRLMLACLAIMVGGSILAFLGGSFLWLIVGRTLQGFSAALIPVGISIMRDELPQEKFGSAVALMSGTLGIGSALALPLAGLLYQSLGWEAIFWVSAFAGTLLLIAVLLVVPESRTRTAGNFDYIGAFLLSASLVALLLGISKGGAWGWDSPAVLLLFLTAVVLLAIWIPYELKVSQPIVDLRTSRRRPVLLTNLASLLVGFALFANVLLTIQQFQLPLATGYGFQLDVISAGLCMVPSALGMVMFSPISGLLIRRFGGKSSLIAGSAVMFAGYIYRVFFWDSIAAVIVGSTLIGIGVAIAYAAMPTLIMEAVPITETASANGINSLVRSIGTSTSSAAVAAVLSSVTLTIGSARLPSFEAFKYVFLMAALASVASIAAAIFIPRAVVSRTYAGSRDPTGAALIQGRILTPGSSPVPRAIVTVLQTTGEHVAWNCADSKGNYAIALPSAGKYFMVAHAAGWDPFAEVFSFDGHTFRQDFYLRNRLQVGGFAIADGRPLEGAVVALLQPSGEYVARTGVGRQGGYSLPLPAPGRYIVTMIHPITHKAVAQKLTVAGHSIRADLTFDTPPHELSIT